MQNQIQNIRKNNWMQFVTVLLLAAFSFQVYSKIAWQHTHILKDGTVVSHAHPYSKKTDSEPVKEHKHSSEELLFLQALENFVVLFYAVAAILLFYFVLHKKLILASEVAAVYIPNNSGRSPPF